MSPDALRYQYEKLLVVEEHLRRARLAAIEAVVPPYGPTDPSLAHFDSQIEKLQLDVHNEAQRRKARRDTP